MPQSSLPLGTFAGTFGDVRLGGVPLSLDSVSITMDGQVWGANATPAPVTSSLSWTPVAGYAYDSGPLLLGDIAITIENSAVTVSDPIWTSQSNV